jgi:hypothetical protein
MLMITIEEAIKELKDASYSEARYGDKDNHHDEVMKRIEAFDMAIQVLEQRLDIHDTCKKCVEFSEFKQKPCEDCISREAVIKIFGEVHPMDYNTQAYITKIQNLPSVTPTISDVENSYDIGYNCGYADAMFDIAEGE